MHILTLLDLVQNWPEPEKLLETWPDPVDNWTKTGRIRIIPKTKLGEIRELNQIILATNRQNLDLLAGIAGTTQDKTNFPKKLGR